MTRRSATIEPSSVEAVSKPDDLSLWQVAKECNEEAGDWSGGAKVLKQRVTDSPALHALLVKSEFDLDKACWAICKRVGQHARQAYWHDQPNGRDRVVQDGGITMLATANLLDYPLMNGVPLGSADDATLDANISVLTSRGKSMLTTARWLSLVKQAKEDAPTVGEALSEQQLKELQRQAEEAMAA